MTNIGKLFVQLFLVISLLIFRSFFLPQLYPFSEPESSVFDGSGSGSGSASLLKSKHDSNHE